MNETERMIAAAKALNKGDFMKLPPNVQGAIAQALGLSGKVYSQNDREKIWQALTKRA